jgi:hypothetical protein
MTRRARCGSRTLSLSQRCGNRGCDGHSGSPACRNPQPASLLVFGPHECRTERVTAPALHRHWHDGTWCLGHRSGVYDALHDADPPRRSRARQGAAIALGRLRGAQGELKYRTARFIRLCPQPAPMGVDDRPADRQAHPHAAGLRGVNGHGLGRATSATGHSRRFGPPPMTSGLPRQADNSRAGWHVSKVHTCRLADFRKIHLN